MTGWLAGAAVAALVAAGTLIVLGSSTEQGSTVSTTDATPESRPAARGGTGRESCSTRSEAEFPGAFEDPGNLVVGPLVLVGGAYTDPATVRHFGGNKFQLLVKNGYQVTLRIAPRGRALAGLAYGRLLDGETRLRDTYREVTFVACRPPGGGGVTFWSGAVLTREPACIPLEAYVNGMRPPRRAGLALGRRCSEQSRSS